MFVGESRVPALGRPLNWQGGVALPTELRAELRIDAENGLRAGGMRRASLQLVPGVSKAVASEISDATSVCSAWSRGLTSRGSKTYPSAAAREGSVRAVLSMHPSRSQANQCQGRRPFKEFFQ